MSDKIQINFHAPRETARKLRIIAADSEITVSELIRRTVNELIERYDIVSVERFPGPEGADRPVLIKVEKK